MSTRTAILIGVIAAGSAVAGPPRYTITELAPINPDGSSWGWSVHADGRIAGARTRDRTQTVGTVWLAEGALDYGPFEGSKHAWATALGSNEAVFGVSRMPAFFAEPLTAWVSGPALAPAVLSYIPQFSDNATMDVNIVNRVAGWTRNGAEVGGQQVHRAYVVLVDGVLRDPVLITTLGGWANWASAINDQNVVVGGSLTGAGPIRAFRWVGGIPRSVGSLGGPADEAADINNAGQIVGWAMNADGARRAFLSDGTTMTDLGTLGGVSAEARGVNDAGAIVGQSWTADGGVHAFVVFASVMHDLNSLTPAADRGWILTRAEDINASGVIVGWGTRFIEGRRYTRGFRLDPFCAADIDADGIIDFADYLEFIRLFDEHDARADLDADGIIDFGDYLDFLNELDGGC